MENAENFAGSGNDGRLLQMFQLSTGDFWGDVIMSSKWMDVPINGMVVV